MKKIIRDMKPNEDCWYDTKLKVAHIKQKINTNEDYWDSLHEIGHLKLNHGNPTDWDDEARMEIEAWKFVLDKSKISIPKSEINRWNKYRIKGSWEKPTDNPFV